MSQGHFLPRDRAPLRSLPQRFLLCNWGLPSHFLPKRITFAKFFARAEKNAKYLCNPKANYSLNCSQMICINENLLLFVLCMVQDDYSYDSNDFNVNHHHSHAGNVFSARVFLRPLAGCHPEDVVKKQRKILKAKESKVSFIPQNWHFHFQRGHFDRFFTLKSSCFGRC